MVNQDLEPILKGGIANLTKRLDRIERKVDIAMKSDQVKMSDLMTIEQDDGKILDRDVPFVNTSKIKSDMKYYGKLTAVVYYNPERDEATVIYKSDTSKAAKYAMKKKMDIVFEDSLKGK